MASPPRNPLASSESNESFDALIDLLASENVAEDPRFNQHASTGLRDDEGNLDLGKIHSFFAAGRDSERVSVNPRSPENRPFGNAFSIPVEGNQEPASSSPTPALSWGFHDIQTSGRATNNSSTAAPRSLSPDGTGHSVNMSTFVFPPANRNTQTLGPGEPHESVKSLVSSKSPVDVIDLEIQSLNEALRLANEEVRQLRQQCDELLASSRSPRSPNHIAQHRIDQPGDMDAHITRAIGEMPPPGLSLPTEVEMLTEEAAKNALSTILHALSLPLSCLQEGIAPVDSSSTARPGTIADVQSALAFTKETDELVWRRSKYNLTNGVGPSGGIFDPENISAIQQRLELWERVVRQYP
ncbi:hypothetical protein FIBSPDRAFT_1049120 [Athelia psychrophila]|uniref:Uncharacterized protein n=1 Tax=Athelia psychrophila TaxID=1759441 RepID=A0A166CSC3_9AGAM|nr:hypothetical protein FIBSPDRAFT_1049120 [Fibularhizoctonia sp. CBS 109695]